MKPLLLMCAFFLSGCCTYLSNEQVIGIANAEINRRKITLPRDYTIRVIKDTFVPESGPKVPLYAVSYNDPHRREAIPVYSVHVNRCSGKIDGFIDTHRISRSKWRTDE